MNQELCTEIIEALKLFMNATGGKSAKKYEYQREVTKALLRRIKNEIDWGELITSRNQDEQYYFKLCNFIGEVRNRARSYVPREIVSLETLGFAFNEVVAELLEEHNS